MKSVKIRRIGYILWDHLFNHEKKTNKGCRDDTHKTDLCERKILEPNASFWEL